MSRWIDEKMDELMGKKEEEPILTIPTLDESQQEMVELLKKLLLSVKSPEQYLSGLGGFLGKAGVGPSGPMPSTPMLNIPPMPPTPPISEATAGGSLISGTDVDAFGGPLGDEMVNALRDALSGRVSEEYFQNTIAGPAITTFKEEIAPGLRQEFVGPGTFWGGARAESVERQGMKLADALSAARGTMAQGALDRQLNAALGYGELQAKSGLEHADFLSRNYNSWINARSQDYNTWAQLTGGAYGDWLDARSQDYNTWQGAKSQDLATYIQAFVQANPNYTDTINSILQYLNTPTLAAYQNPEYIPDVLQDALEGGGWA